MTKPSPTLHSDHQSQMPLSTSPSDRNNWRAYPPVGMTLALHSLALSAARRATQRRHLRAWLDAGYQGEMEDWPPLASALGRKLGPHQRLSSYLRTIYPHSAMQTARPADIALHLPLTPWPRLSQAYAPALQHVGRSDQALIGPFLATRIVDSHR